MQALQILQRFLADVGETIVNGLLPTIAAVAAGKYVAERCDNATDAVGYGSLAAGGAAALLCTPIGQFGAACYGGYKLLKLGCKLAMRLT